MLCFSSQGITLTSCVRLYRHITVTNTICVVLVPSHLYPLFVFILFSLFILGHESVINCLSNSIKLILIDFSLTKLK